MPFVTAWPKKALMASNDKSLKTSVIDAGYTFVEIAIVLSIVGVIALFAAPNILGRMSQVHLTGAKSAVRAELRTVRMQAMSEGIPVVAEVDTSENELTLKIDRNGNSTFETNETTTLNIDQYRNVIISANTSLGTFYPLGTFRCSSGVWKIALKSVSAGTNYVYVFAGGQVEDSKDKI